MKRLILRSVAALPCLWLGACASGEHGGPGDGTLSVGVAALTGAEVADACYDLTVTNGSGQTVWSQAGVCGSQYGNATGITYIGSCDAGDNDHTVTVELASLSTGTGVIPASGYLNPCPVGQGCSKTVTCQENADVPVDFDLTVLLQAEQGFLDITVDLEFLQCSAKLDCVDGTGAPLELLHDASGERGQTVVVGLTCLWDACPESGSWLYTDDITIACDEGVAVISPAGPGGAAVSQTADIVFGALLYSGSAQGSGYYQNLAIGFNGGTHCTLQTTATVTDAQLTNQTLPAGGGHPAVGWSLPLTGTGGELTCTQHPLNGTPAGVSSFYPSAPEDLLFDHERFQPGDCGGPQIELCNGIDDDGDGVIDEGCDLCTGVICPAAGPCSEVACDPGTGECVETISSDGTTCFDSGLATSVVPNPSFEDHSGCPTTFSQLSFADTWIQATDATSDYFIGAPTCDETWFINGAELGPMPHHAPDGDAFVGAAMVDATYIEYIGACLTTPLAAGTAYSFEMQVAAPGPPPPGAVGGGDTDAEIALLCVPDCADLPIAGLDDKTDDFPVLATTAVSLVGGAPWQAITLTTTPAQSCPAVIFGPTVNTTFAPGLQAAYILFDGLVLNETTSFEGVCSAGACQAQ